MIKTGQILAGKGKVTRFEGFMRCDVRDRETQCTLYGERGFAGMMLNRDLLEERREGLSVYDRFSVKKTPFGLGLQEK